jgi:predicted RNase H-like HicB family nuclease
MTEALLVERVEDYTDKTELEPRPLRLEPLRAMPSLDERVRRGIADVEHLPRLPMQLIDKYVEVAMRHAILKRHSDGWFAAIHGFQGVWAKGRSEEQALEVLKEVLLDWTLLKIEHQDGDLPVIEEIDLNVL